MYVTIYIYEFIGVTLDVNSLCTSISNQENTEAAKEALKEYSQVSDNFWPLNSH